MKKSDREIVFNKYNGRCAYCGCVLEKGWQVDHAISKNCFWQIDPLNPNSVNCIENYNPACRECNHYKRSHCVEDFGMHIGFRTFMKNFHKRLAKLPKKTRLKKTEKRILYMQTIASKYNITVDKPFSGLFFFDTFKQAS